MATSRTDAGTDCACIRRRNLAGITAAYGIGKNTTAQKEGVAIDVGLRLLGRHMYYNL
jgi:hypothetical protein